MRGAPAASFGWARTRQPSRERKERDAARLRHPRVQLIGSELPADLGVRQPIELGIGDPLEAGPRLLADRAVGAVGAADVAGSNFLARPIRRAQGCRDAVGVFGERLELDATLDPAARFAQVTVEQLLGLVLGDAQDEREGRADRV